MITKTAIENPEAKINWKVDGSFAHNESESVMQAREHYFDMLRAFLLEVETAAALGDTQRVREAFLKYNVHFVDVDSFPRVNLDEPQESKSNG